MIIKKSYFPVYVLTAAFFLVAVPFTDKTNIILAADTPAATPITTPVISPAATPAITPAASPAPTPQKIKTSIEKFKYLGWWGDINYNKTGIYTEPTRNSKYLGNFTTINRVKILEEVKGEMVGTNDLWYKIDGGMHPGAYIYSNDVTPITEPAPPAAPKIPATVKEGDYWIDIDLTNKTLSLFSYDKPVFATYVSTGVYGSPTRPGTFKIVYKIEKTRMRGRPPITARTYDLPNVPYAMFYYGSYSLHGTYWHDKFGTRQSSGCTNMTQGDAKFIFNLVNPVIKPPAKLYTVATADNPGTTVYIHY